MKPKKVDIYFYFFSISIYNSLGLEIKRFGADELVRNSSLNYSTKELASGIYYCIINNGTYNISKSFMVLK